ncbi:DUF4440 domain-containing protein [Streptomyces sp. NPDC048338]|uniref:nuclear transport factor 2 family protein n=1 Tax=Streptomyces sp. NPDC048338 TaxID=3365536 RepID=UPI003713F298
MTDLPPAVAAAVEGELRLLDPTVRSSVKLFSALLHPDFEEFGTSGRRWDRASIIAAMTAGASPRSVTASDMHGVQLAPDVVHLTFATESHGVRSHRSSIWRLTEGHWLLYFHQGTPAPVSPPESPAD